MNEPAAVIIAVLTGAFCVGPLWISALFSLWPRTPNFVQRTLRMEYKINLIAKHLGMGDPGDSNPILRELWNGNKINAIKIYREQTGVGLKEAKDVIDALERGEIVTLEHDNGSA